MKCSKNHIGRPVLNNPSPKPMVYIRISFWAALFVALRALVASQVSPSVKAIITWTWLAFPLSISCCTAISKARPNDVPPEASPHSSMLSFISAYCELRSQTVCSLSPKGGTSSMLSTRIALSLNFTTAALSGIDMLST